MFPFAPLLPRSWATKLIVVASPVHLLLNETPPVALFAATFPANAAGMSRAAASAGRARRGFFNFDSLLAGDQR